MLRPAARLARRRLVPNRPRDFSRASQPACRPRLYHVNASLLLLNGFRNGHVRWLQPLFRVLSTVWGVWGLV